MKLTRSPDFMLIYEREFMRRLCTARGLKIAKDKLPLWYIYPQRWFNFQVFSIRRNKMQVPSYTPWYCIQELTSVMKMGTELSCCILTLSCTGNPCLVPNKTKITHSQDGKIDPLSVRIITSIHL